MPDFVISVFGDEDEAWLEFPAESPSLWYNRESNTWEAHDGDRTVAIIKADGYFGATLAPKADDGYSVELGDQRFTETQWEAVQRYARQAPSETLSQVFRRFFEPSD